MIERFEASRQGQDFLVFVFHNTVCDYAMRYTRAITVAVRLESVDGAIGGKVKAGFGIASCSIDDTYDADDGVTKACGRALGNFKNNPVEGPFVELGEQVATRAERKARIIDKRRAKKSPKVYEHVIKPGKNKGMLQSAIFDLIGRRASGGSYAARHQRERGGSVLKIDVPDARLTGG